MYACVCAQNRDSRRGTGEWCRQDEVRWSSYMGSRWQGWAASGMTKWCLIHTNCPSNTQEQARSAQLWVLLPGGHWQPGGRGRHGPMLKPFPWPHYLFWSRHSQSNTSMYKAGDLGDARPLTQSGESDPVLPEWSLRMVRDIAGIPWISEKKLLDSKDPSSSTCKVTMEKS